LVKEDVERRKKNMRRQPILIYGCVILYRTLA
jgi:hypothetical protein